MAESEELAAAAARWVVEEGLDYASAKRRAAKALGWGTRAPLPSNEQLEAAIREHLALYHADTHPAQLRALRELALVWMRRFEEFHPLLCGAVWRGTASVHSDIDLRLYCDDAKSLEFKLLNEHLAYELSSHTNQRGQEQITLSVLVKLPDPSFPQPHQLWIHLSPHPFDEIRGARKGGVAGLPETADIKSLSACLQTPS